MASARLLKAGGSVRAVLDAWGRAIRPQTVLPASPRSLCAGLEWAIEVVEALLERYAP
ncbi:MULTISPECIES: hypothetical protein [Streptomyces]|uniref:hypothetical protein n=1 Tax=Streptomyces TaxID=1883 RepID=UPI001F5F74EA|nr:hypothetical protein [Streptomyces kasugaensis]